MRTLEQKLREEYGWLQNVMCEVKNRMSNAPQGQLRIARKRKGVEYYYKEEDFAKRGKSSNGRYMKKDEFSLVVRLAQRDYDKNIIKKAEERSACIDEFLKKYQKTSLKEVYSKTNEYRKKFASSDYSAIKSDIVRQTFSKVISLDLTKNLKEIETPVLLMWGENDMDTPLYMAKIMEKNIKDSGLVVLKNAGHFSYIDKSGEFNLIVDKFLS